MSIVSIGNLDGEKLRIVSYIGKKLTVRVKSEKKKWKTFQIDTEKFYKELKKSNRTILTTFFIDDSSQFGDIVTKGTPFTGIHSLDEFSSLAYLLDEERNNRVLMKFLETEDISELKELKSFICLSDYVSKRQDRELNSLGI